GQDQELVGNVFGMRVVLGFDRVGRDRRRSDANDLLSRWVYVVPALAYRVRAVANDAVAMQAKPGNAALSEHPHALGNILVRTLHLFVGNDAVDAPNQGYRARPLGPQDFGAHDAVLHALMHHDRVSIRIFHPERDRGIDHGRIEAHLDVRARPGVGIALDDIEAG